LSERFEALLVDVDNNDGPQGHNTRLYDLEQIEGLDANFLERGRIGYAQKGKSKQQYNA